ncbi:MAG: lactate racemase domain-containing protein [Bacteroidetes bacterium]|nr:lactate racemase domain-containing protein [Bacteroidota bacterium]
MKLKRPIHLLTPTEISTHLADGLHNRFQRSDKVLVIIPDSTRSLPLPVLFREITDQLMGQVTQLDFMIALGTHPPMSEDAILSHVGITPTAKTTYYANVNLFNHTWNHPESLVTLTTISDEEVSSLTDGLIKMPLPVTINRKILDYDVALVCGPVFPHEVAGFSGGNKYFFPGISGPEVIDFTHWVGALMSSRQVIGTYDTPIRRLINRAAQEIPCFRMFINLVVLENSLAGIYIGDHKSKAWLEAAEHSSKLHISWMTKPVNQALARIPLMYDDLWTGAKGMYKLEPVIADGGEIILFAPHICELSYTHGRLLDRIGFHGIEFFRAHWETYQHFPWTVLAHSAHVRGDAIYINGEETPRIQLTLASLISKERCKKVGLGYCDPKSIDLTWWETNTHPDYLYVPRAGEHLFRLTSNSID